MRCMNLEPIIQSEVSQKEKDEYRVLTHIRVSEVAQSCPTLCDAIDYSLPGSSVHGIFQAIVLEWIAISFSRGSSQPRAQTQVSRIVDRYFTVWATREVLYTYIYIYINRVTVLYTWQECNFVNQLYFNNTYRYILKAVSCEFQFYLESYWGLWNRRQPLG